MHAQASATAVSGEAAKWKASQADIQKQLDKALAENKVSCVLS